MSFKKIWKDLNLFGAAQSRAREKLKQLKAYTTLDKLKIILSNEDVETTFRSDNPKALGDYSNWVTYIIYNCIRKIPVGETIPLAKFIVNNTVANKIVKICSENHEGILRSTLSRLNLSLYTLVEKTPPEKREELVKIMAEDGFARTVIGLTNPHYYITPLSEGRSLKKFGLLLNTTQLFIDVPQNDFIKDEILAPHLANRIALFLLLSDKPELRNTQGLNPNLHSTDIEDVDMDESERSKYQERAWEYAEIAFSRCKGGLG